MKKIIAIALSAVMALSLVACGGEDSPQTEEKKPVKNPVRSELYDDSDNKMADISYEYDENGLRLSNTTTWIFNGDSETDKYTYDENGNVIKKVGTYSFSPEYESVRNYIYDENGLLIKENWGADEFYIGYEYDENGHLTQQFSMNDGTRYQGLVYQCDENGNVLTETQNWDDGDVSVHTYTYDVAGKLLKVDYSFNGEIMYTHNYEYDAEGNMTKQGVSIESWKLEGYVVHYYE